MKNKFFRALAIIMIFCISLVMVGCLGAPPDDYPDDGGDVPGFGEETVFDMYGTKVLYRPTNYDYDLGSGANPGEKNDYYGKYAWHIFRALTYTYGIVDEIAFPFLKDIFPDTLSENKTYFYDSIRYKFDTKAEINKRIFPDGTIETFEELGEDNYKIYGADLSSSWNWSIDYDLSVYDSKYNSLFINETPEKNFQPIYNNSNSHVYYRTDDQDLIEWDLDFNSNEHLNTAITNYYSSSFSNDFYQPAFVGSQDNYSDYVKALEYVVYSYALDLEPHPITVTVNDNVTEGSSFYTVNVSGYESVDKAVEDIQALFKKIGSYVGLINRQINKISAWIKNNVIGVGTAVNNDNFYTYYDCAEIVGEDNETVIGYQLNTLNNSSQNAGRDYDRAVDEIVRLVCENVSIGSDNGEDVHVDSRFLASEIKEYACNTFMIQDDANFPKYQPGQSKAAIQPLEYQSAVIMLKDLSYISDVWVALKYDADEDGTEEGVYNMDKYLDIIVELNYYNNRTNKLINVDSKLTRVYDGPYEFGLSASDYPQYPGLPDDHGMVMFTDFENNKALSELLVEGGLSVGPFNTNIGGGILMTDVGQGGYGTNPYISNNPLLIVGTTDVRKYYSIIEPDDKELDSEHTYITGRLNSDMFAGADGSDYLEITYKVLKRRGDTSTNYKFYTGLIGMFDSGADL